MDDNERDRPAKAAPLARRIASEDSTVMVRP
jgi:hypothetical protein